VRPVGQGLARAHAHFGNQAGLCVVALQPGALQRGMGQRLDGGKGLGRRLL
jgi:hypothetical protein